MRHHPDVFLILIFSDYLREETVSGGQFIWGGCLNEGVIPLRSNFKLEPHLQGRLGSDAESKFGCMLEPPSIFSTTKVKMRSADNQQGSPAMRGPSETIRRCPENQDDDIVRTAWRQAEVPLKLELPNYAPNRN